MVDIKINIDVDIDSQVAIDAAKKYGKAEAKILADQIFSESQLNCPVRTGALKASGYIKESETEYEVGYSKDYAHYVDSIPSSWLAQTSGNGKGRFFSDAVDKAIESLNSSGGGLNGK